MRKRSAALLVGGWCVIAPGCSGSAATGQVTGDGGPSTATDASFVPDPGTGGSSPSNDVPIACASDKDCRAAGKLCDTQRSVCVDCLDDSLCPKGQLCADGACRAKCTSDKDCTSAGLLCDVRAGHCVDPGSGGSGGSRGSGGQGGGSGSGNGGSGNSGDASGSGGMGGDAGSGGSGGAAGSGGASGAGGDSAGASGSGGAGGAGGASGSGGSAGSSGAGGTQVVDAGGACGPLIDDMEDGNGYICKGDGRIGRWYTFSVGGTVTPSATAIPAPPALTPAGGTGGLYGMHVVGSATAGGALGLDLKNDDVSYGSYDAGAYTGIRFWALGNVSLQVRVNCASTTSTQYGGTCNAAVVSCNANYATTTLTASWALYSVPFSSLSFGSYAFSSHNLTNIQFFTTSTNFNFWIDDVSFY